MGFLVSVGLLTTASFASEILWQIGDIESATLERYPRSSRPIDYQLALRWEDLQQNFPQSKIIKLTQSDLIQEKLKDSGVSVLVIPDRIEEAPSEAILSAIREFVDSGGGLFLNAEAIVHAYDLGVETAMPNDLARDFKDSNYWYGFELLTTQPHPIFKGLIHNAPDDQGFLLNGAKENSRLQISSWKGCTPSQGTI